ncbi:hypothetical protein D3C71_77070 [compost metagenome]
MPTETKELILRVPTSLHAWLADECRNKPDNRNSLEKEAIYRLEHSRELGEVSRAFYIVLSARDGTYPRMELSMRGKKMFEVDYIEPDHSLGSARPNGFWSLAMHDHPESDMGHHRVPGPRAALHLMRGHLSVMLMQWISKQAQNGNTAAVKQAIQAKALIAASLDAYERDCVDRRSDGIYTVNQTVLF